MKKYLEKLLSKLGYTDIEWHKGRKGYYVLGKWCGSTVCIDIADLVQRELACSFLSDLQNS